jgi:hypothetical protein
MNLECDEGSFLPTWAGLREGAVAAHLYGLRSCLHCPLADLEEARPVAALELL